MKTKATQNLYSAQLLINNGQYTTSVHCSYYAVFQYMKYMLSETDRNPIPLSVQNTNNNISSHEYIIQEIGLRINDNKKNRKFEQKVRNLKNERVQADYYATSFSDLESLDCIDKAKGLITDLKTFFGNI